MSSNVRESKQSRALVALLNSATIAKAAADVGISERQLHRWLAEPTFAAEYARLRREATQHAVARLQTVASHAAGVLVALFADASIPPAVRLSAAKTVLEFALKSVELDDVLQRLTALEGKL
jgi:hypothetical protein